MTTLIPSALPPTGPSPARNPFARPKLPSAGSFTRTSLLPSHVSPQKTPRALVTPADKNATGTRGTSAAKGAIKSWRLLWRGGLEVGAAGWRLEGIMFYAMLAFPSTPSHSQGNVNPFDMISPPRPTNAASPFALPSADTDLCLSLESMRGRKYLQVRGLTDLPEDEVLEGDTDEAGVQISISPQAPLLVGYLTSVLCRSGKLSAQGRTLSAIIIGLGDEGDQSPLLVYGQKQVLEDEANPGSVKTTLKLCVARRKVLPPPPSVKKVRPGDPLPRAPLFFPSRSFNKKPSHRPLLRTTSSASIYAPPVLQHSVSAPVPLVRTQSHLNEPRSDQVPSNSISGRTPGRRGEKRKRPQAEEDEKKRKSGKIVLDKNDTRAADDEGDGDEDIFGKRPSARASISFELPSKSDGIEAAKEGEDRSGEPASTAKKRPKIPQQILDNKATVRKQTLLLLESSEYPRDHEQFKELFSIVTKGTYFAFRAEMEIGPLCKLDVQRVVGIHLDMYLPKTHSHGLSDLEEVKERPQNEGVKGEQEGDESDILRSIKEEEGDKSDILRSIKEEDEDEETLVDITEVKPKGDL